ncbi:hypothetical protein [Pedobacter jamesrossensis]|uniref:Uncharacterized protein n=1 Tax=Pedobacter jamesrossensis TaxID=1908238 RepID=A0ABV8NMR0_9SPHI
MQGNRLLTNLDISQGQKQIIDTAIELLEKYKLSNIDRNNHEANFELLDMLANNEIVINDKYTGCSIPTKTISKHYLSWLVSTSQNEVPKNLENFDFNRMIFNGSVEEQHYGYHRGDENFAYEGGATPMSLS